MGRLGAANPVPTDVRSVRFLAGCQRIDALGERTLPKSEYFSERKAMLSSTSLDTGINNSENTDSTLRPPAAELPAEPSITPASDNES